MAFLYVICVLPDVQNLTYALLFPTSHFLSAQRSSHILRNSISATSFEAQASRCSSALKAQQGQQQDSTRVRYACLSICLRICLRICLCVGVWPEPNPTITPTPYFDVQPSPCASALHFSTFILGWKFPPTKPADHLWPQTAHCSSTAAPPILYCIVPCSRDLAPDPDSLGGAAKPWPNF